MENTVNKIIDELNNRNGFDDLWFNIHKETKEEIKNEIKQIVKDDFIELLNIMILQNEDDFDRGNCSCKNIINNYINLIKKE